MGYGTLLLDSTMGRSFGASVTALHGHGEVAALDKCAQLAITITIFFLNRLIQMDVVMCGELWMDENSAIHLFQFLRGRCDDCSDWTPNTIVDESRMEN